MVDFRAILAAKRALAEGKAEASSPPEVTVADVFKAIDSDKATALLAIADAAKEQVKELTGLNGVNFEDIPTHAKAAFPAEAFEAAKPLSFKEKMALEKAKREAAGKPLPAVTLRPMPVVTEETKAAQDKIHAEVAAKAEIKNEVASLDEEEAALQAQLAIIAERKRIIAAKVEEATIANVEWQRKQHENAEKSNLKITAEQFEAEKKFHEQAKAKAEQAAALRAAGQFSDGIKSEIQVAVGKLSFADKMKLKQLAQAAAREAVEEMELASEPPAELPVALQDEDTNAVTLGNIDDLDTVFNKAEAKDVTEVEDTGAFSLNIVLNTRQLMAKEMALQGKNFALIGAAGTGKTTTQRSVAETLVEDDRLRTCSYKLTGGAGGIRVDAPSIAFVAYTRRASANLARAIHKSPRLAETLKHNIMTIHALLEFEPEEFWNDEKQKQDFRFTPKRDANNPLTITHLVIEEASMLGLDLWEKLFAALPSGVQIIFIGDINQLPPVFGASILNYALVQLPIIELTEVYRNAGIVLASAHNILAGKPVIEGESYDEDTGALTGKVSIVRGKSPVQVGQGKMSMSLGKMFKAWYDMGYYDPDKHMILSPWNKKDLGTDNMNSWIAQFLGEKRNAVVWEIVSGFNKLYLAVGDKVMYNKQDAVITEIKFNSMYHGQTPQAPGQDLGRFGVRILGAEHISTLEIEDQLLTYSNFSVDELEETAMERKQQASHIVTIETETGQKISLSAAGDFGPQTFSLGYVLTVHKAQGCEWEKVFIIMHKDHAVSLTRELFYTALTRARMECIVIAKDTVIEQAIKTQRIKGNTLADKVEYFNSGAMDIAAVSCVK